MKTLPAVIIVALATSLAAAPQTLTREEAVNALEKGVGFFRTEVSVQGTYLWQYSDDLSKREGEGKATAMQGWVQPPGTPSVGLAFLSAWQATSNNYYLEAARETAHALARGQLLSGGWTYSIDFSEEGRRKLAYRDGGKKTARNFTTFDDDTTQCALRFLMRTDAAFGFHDTKIRDTINYALSSILKAQYSNGAWPQGYDQFPDPKKFPVQRASYPESWPRIWPGSSHYWLRYTLNDNALARTIETLFEAERIYRERNAGPGFNKLGAQCRAAAMKAGDFLLRAQMPEPQPAWAQQYDFETHPSWARKFEPPSVTGGESQGALRTLMRIYTETGDAKYLEPIPRALNYLRRSRLPNGQLARFYELGSNKALYFTKTYELTYDDRDMPTHYAFKVRDDTDAIAREFERVKSVPAPALKKIPVPPRSTEVLRNQVLAIIAGQDARGRWLEEGRLRHHGANDPTTRVIRSATFAEHVETLCRFIRLTDDKHASLLQVSASDDLAVSSFDSRSYGDWKATGTAFQKGPASGNSIEKLEIENVVGVGVASSEIEGDGPTGTLTSPAFVIERAYISFLIGGGNYEHHTCLNLLVGGKVVRSATGWNSDRLVPASWDVRPFAGQQANIQLVDEASGSWGHINVDHIVQTDRPDRLPVVTQPLYQETHRPQFHFTARQWTMDRLNPGMRQEGWLNDLNGLIFYDGEYHLFAQRWNKCWIHAVSQDLVHWTELEPAFWEEQLDSGVQSGTCVVDYANTSGLAANTNQPALVAFWSRNDNRSHCISYSLDRGRTWKHYEKNPVLIHPERDPKIFWHAPTRRWVMFLYGEQNKERLYHIFTSTNLLSWRDEKHPIRNSYECPDFFQLPLDGDRNRMKWVLVRGDGKYSIGDFNGLEFSEETPQFDSDAGPNFYATQTWENTPEGRRMQIAWMRGGTYPDMPFNQQVTFPRELTLRATPEGPRLFRQPIHELEILHDIEQIWTNCNLTAGQALPLAPAGNLFRVQAELTIDEGATLTMNVRGTKVSFTPQSMTCGAKPVALRTALRNFEALVDRTSVETFANDGEASMSKCFLPTESGLFLKIAGGHITINRLKLVYLKPAWN